MSCWGASDTAPGAGSAGGRALVQGLADVIAIAGGEMHVCALDTTGLVTCWGDDNYGQLGADGVSKSVSVPGAIAISAGGTHTCARLVSHEVVCWGKNSAGERGDGSYDLTPAPTRVQGLRDAVAISCGVGHTCALLSNGRVNCWGAGSEGQLGNGWDGAPTTPVRVEGLDGVQTQDAGDRRTCAVRASGEVYYWGTYPATTFTPESARVRPTPERVADLDDAQRIAVSDGYACALRASGDVSCWGVIWKTFSDELPYYLPTPTHVAHVTPESLTYDTRAGRGWALQPNGRVLSWGRRVVYDPSMQAFSDSLTPVELPGLQDVVGLGLGAAHVCAVHQAGGVGCWGDNTWVLAVPSSAPKLAGSPLRSEPGSAAYQLLR